MQQQQTLAIFRISVKVWNLPPLPAPKCVQKILTEGHAWRRTSGEYVSVKSFVDRKAYFMHQLNLVVSQFYPSFVPLAGFLSQSPHSWWQQLKGDHKRNYT